MSETVGKVVAISISAERGVQKTNVDSARLIEDSGIEGDAHAGPGIRQVSFLALESIDEMRARGAAVNPGDFAENITTEGVKHTQAPVGSGIRIGETELEVTKIGKECHSRCAIFEQVGDCVMPREGYFAKVVTGGTIRPGDTVRVFPPADARQDLTPAGS